MNEIPAFGPSVEMEVCKFKNGKPEKTIDTVATEIPFTITVNDKEIATLLCSPVSLKELSYGFIYTSGLIKSAAEIRSFSLDTTRWIASLEIEEMPDPSLLLHKRLYTTGCGKGVMYANINEMAYRQPIKNDSTIHYLKITQIARWLQSCSGLFRATGAVHTAALSIMGETPLFMYDDVGRHNAVDKVIGKALLDKIPFVKSVLISSGRTSSEILHKARMCGIAINISRGAPTHQTVLRARELGITVVGFARSGNFTVYSHEERICIE